MMGVRSMNMQLPDITIPQQGAATVRTVLNAYMRDTVKSFATISPHYLSPNVRALFASTLAFMQHLLKEDPRRIVLALRQPTHGALLWTLLRESTPHGDHGELNELVAELCLLIHTEMAMHGTVVEGLSIPKPSAHRWPTLRSISGAFVMEIDPEVEHIAFAPRAVKLTKAGETWIVPFARDGILTSDAPVRVTHPYHPIVEGIFLAVSDNNPLSMFEAHPDKTGNAIDLGGHPAEEWLATLRAAFEIVDKYLPGIGEEMRLILRTIVPVGYEPEKHLSASYMEAIGTVYMTLHPNLMTMTEALIHEFQHNKLNTALHLDPILHNAFSPLYTSPVRPDPRPLHGIMLAVHAFQPIARLYELMTADGHPLSKTPSWTKRHRDIIRMDRAGANTVLKNGQPTPTGSGFLAEMRRIDGELHVYEDAHWTAPPAVEPPPLPE